MIIKKNKSMNLKFHKLIKTFNIFIKQCHCIIWSIEKVHKLKTQNLYRQKTEA